MSFKLGHIVYVLCLSACGAVGESQGGSEPTAATAQAVTDGDNGSGGNCAVGFQSFYNDSTTDMTKKFCQCVAGRNNQIGLMVDATCGGEALWCQTTTIPFQASCGVGSPTYPMNRLYDLGNEHLGCQCITTAGVYGTMKSKCQTLPATCGYLYCLAN